MHSDIWWIFWSQDAKANVSKEQLEGVQKTIEMVGQQLKQLTTNQHSAPKNMEEASKKEYKFWETQPVPKLSEYTALWLCSDITIDLVR